MAAFLLVASFGLLFVGCTPADTTTEPDAFTFTEEDVARFRELANEADPSAASETTGTGVAIDVRDGTGAVANVDIPVLDLSMVDTYSAIRSGPAASGDDLFRVTNAFLNMRSEPRSTAGLVQRLSGGDMLIVTEFVDAAWAKVQVPNGPEGYVSTRYIAKLVGDDELAAEKEAYAGQYFVDFGFLNVRSAPDSQSEKLGELPGQSIISPITIDDQWARITFEGREAYASSRYLSPFQPNFLVRQERYDLPILHYQMSQPGVEESLGQHVQRLRAEGYNLLTFRDFYDLILEQEEKDARLDPNSVLIAVSEVTPENLDTITGIFRANNARATLFITTEQLGMDGITELQALTLSNDGFDLQSGSHTGDDLRSLTNAKLELELKQSRQLLEEYTDRDIFAIAYPWGGANERVMSMAAEAGYLFGLGVTPDDSFARSEFLRLPSYQMNGSMTADDVLSIVESD